MKPLNVQVIDFLTSKIYECVLGMTRDEFIAAAKERAGDSWDYIGWGDDDEAARDWLSIEALSQLSEAESQSAKYIEKYGLPELHLLIELANRYKVKEENVWSKQAKGNSE